MTILAPPLAAAFARSASKTYGAGATQVAALRDVSVSFETGKLTAIMGPSGSGKSTLLQTMAGLDRLTSGEAWIGDCELSTLSEKALTRLRRDRLGFIFQSFNLLPVLTAEENIYLPIDLAGRRGDKDWIDLVVRSTGLEDRLRHRPSQLSGGQQQRVAVARALASRPELIFADEPTGALDTHSSTEILGLLRTATSQWNQTVAMVTHDPVAAAFADRVLFLADGEIVDELFEPTVDAILAQMKGMR